MRARRLAVRSAISLLTAMSVLLSASAQDASPEDWGVPDLQVIDLMQAASRFYQQSATGAVTSDYDSPLFGTTSLRLAVSGTDGQLNLRAEPREPLDLSASNLVVWLRLEDPEALDYVSLYVANDGFAAFNSYLLAVGVTDASARLGQPGEWHAVSVNLADPDAAVGQVDLSRVDALQVSLRAAGDEEAAISVNGVASFPRPPRGSATVMFDDSRDGALLAAPVLDELGLRASVAVISEFLGQPGFLSLEDLIALERDFGWEAVAHHTAAAPLELSFDRLEPLDLTVEFEKLTAWMRATGLTRGVDHIVYPNGRIDEEALETVKRYFTSGRTTVKLLGLETWPPGDPYRLRATSVLSSDPPAALTALIDRAAASGGWLILVFHQVVEGESEFETQYRLADLELVMRHLAAADVDVYLLSERWP